MSISLDTSLSLAEDILYAPVSSDEGVLMNVGAGRYHSLNAVGSRVLELLDCPRTVAELCQHIQKEFKVDSRACEEAVLSFADQLLSRGIIRAQ